MLTHLKIRNFKKFKEVDFELGKSVVLIGPNNSGKTTALQALALWEIGLKRWLEKRSGKSSSGERPGVAINRRDLIAIPIPDANLLWRDLHVRNIAERGSGQQKTQNIRIDIVIDGITNGRSWSCGLEFDYANEESFYCRPLRLPEMNTPLQRMSIPEEAASVRVVFLPPMSGLVAVEPQLQPGRINVLLGEGQTAQVLRNLCYQIYEKPAPNSEWEALVRHIDELFGARLLEPRYIPARGEITMSYQESKGITLDILSSGRGLQQTLLLLAHLYINPNTVLLLDEPDAHLEVLRQRQIYQLLTQIAEKQDSQVVAASHSEVVLNEAAGRDVVIAFVGKPHRIDDRGSQVLKALTDIGFDQYYQAEQTGWVLYLEGPSDLAILQTFAATLGHEAMQYMERPFVHYVSTNLPQKAREHFFGLREAKPDLVGLALFDRLDKSLQTNSPLRELMWQRREIENYICQEQVLIAYARNNQPNDLFGLAEANQRERVMRECIAEISEALKILQKPSPWSDDIKASDDFLDPLFERYFEKLGLPNLLRKTDYHILARLLPRDLISPEIVEKLNTICVVVQSARPRTE
jgi:energy-coupling factor transporter ATP-binding protein EcfA2